MGPPRNREARDEPQFTSPIYESEAHMSIDSNPLPATVMQRLRAQHDNECAIEYLLSGNTLPAPAITPRAEAVYVSLANVDDLGPWLELLGGEIHTSPVFEGVELWTLHTVIDGRVAGVRVSVRVSVPVPDRDEVMWDIRAAVAR